VSGSGLQLEVRKKGLEEAEATETKGRQALQEDLDMEAGGEKREPEALLQGETPKKRLTVQVALARMHTGVNVVKQDGTAKLRGNDSDECLKTSGGHSSAHATIDPCSCVSDVS
jgi:hypothetical protein